MAAPDKPSLGRSFSLVAILTIFSKLAGLVRDLVVSYFYGASVLADAYNYAYLFTGNVLILFGGLGGPFHSATVATLNPRKEDPKSGLLMTQVLVATGVILTALALLVYLLAPYLVQQIFGSYGKDIADPAKQAQIYGQFFKETVFQVRIMSPLITIAGLVGVTYGILNVYNKLFWPSLSPAIASLAIVVAVIVFPSKDSSWPLAVGSLVGAFGQLFAQLPGLFKCNLHFKFSLKPAPGLHEYVSLLWPAMIATSIGQLTIYVDSFFCSMIPNGEGAWTAISNANRLIQLPLGVLITAMIVPLLPRFSDQVTANKPEEVKREFRRALSFLWFVSMPLTMVLLVIPEPIVRALYQRGHWTQEATDLVVSALIFLAPSIVIYIGRDLITRVFIAYQDTKTPYYVGMAAIAIKAILDWYFVIQLHMAIAGISLATTLITLFNFCCLSYLLRRKIGNLGVTKLVAPVAIMFIATVVAGFCTYFGYKLLEPFLASLSKTSHIVQLISLLTGVAATSGAGLLVYSGICLALKLEEPQMLLRRLKLIPAKEINAETNAGDD